ncbi:MAG: N-acetyltransferase family protein [Gemmatimonadota bacterium]
MSITSFDQDRPAPEVLENWCTSAGQELAIRPVAADDAARELHFMRSLSPQTRYERTFSHRGLMPGELQQLVRFDVRREIALLAAAGRKPDEEIVAVARLRKSPDGSQCEFAIVVGDKWQRQGIGARLLGKLLEVAKLAGVRRVTGRTMATNQSMKALARKVGFELHPDPDDATVTLLSIDL